mgnify:CR=1 FL=1
MRELMHEVAKLIEDLKSLKLLQERDYYTSLIKNEQQKYRFRITVYSQSIYATAMVNLCLEQFRKLAKEREDKFDMKVVENSESTRVYIFTVEYTEL